MKQKLKKILLLYLFTGTLFVSCTMEEEVIRNHNYSKDIKIYQKSFDELIKDSKFATSFNKLPKRKTNLKSGEQARTVMEEQYGFTITNSPVRVVQVGNLTSYTFHIERNTPNSTYFENLVVQNDSIGNTTAHIIKYTPFMPMTSYTEHNSYSFTGNTEFTSIIYDDNISNINGRVVTSCTNLYRTKCNGASNGSCTAATHIVSGACLTYSPNCIFLEFQTSSCYSYDDGQSDGEVMSDMDAIGGNNTSGGSGTGGTTPIYSDPLCPTCPEIDSQILSPQDLCNDLAAKDANPTFAANMQDLKTRAASQNVESAYVMFQNATAGLQFSSRQDGVSPQDAEVILTPYVDQTLTPTNSIGAIHCHLDNGTTFKIFSFADLLALAEFANVSTQPTSQFGIYVVTSSGTFCIKIKNKIQLKQMLVRMQMTLSIYEQDFDILVDKNKNLTDQVIGFLNFLKDKQFSNCIELFKKDENNNIWQKQELSSDGKNAISINC